MGELPIVCQHFKTISSTLTSWRQKVRVWCLQTRSCVLVTWFSYELDTLRCTRRPRTRRRHRQCDSDKRFRVVCGGRPRSFRHSLSRGRGRVLAARGPAGVTAEAAGFLPRAPLTFTSHFLVLPQHRRARGPPAPNKAQDSLHYSTTTDHSPPLTN